MSAAEPRSCLCRYLPTHTTSAVGADNSSGCSAADMRSRSGSVGGASTGCLIVTSSPFSTKSANLG